MKYLNLYYAESLLDKDDLIGDFNEVFSSPYYLAHSTLSLNKAYVLNVDLNCDGTKYCASFSNRHVNVYTESLTTLCKLEPHEKSITQTSFRYQNHGNPLLRN